MNDNLMVFDRVCEIIEGCGGGAARDITRETAVGDLGLDSLDLLQFILSLEQEFSIELEDVDLRNLQNFGDLCDLIKGRF